MSTHSSIAVQLPSGTIKEVYCHFDGYISGVGKMLIEHYNSFEKASEIVELGSLSFLEKKITPTLNYGHSFTNHEPGVTVAYHRDRGDKLSIDTYPDIEFYKYASRDTKNNYIFMDGNWYAYVGACKRFTLISECLKEYGDYASV